MASRRRTASSFVLGKDEDVREKKRKVGVCVVVFADTTVERDGKQMIRVADDAVVRGSCPRKDRKDIMSSCRSESRVS